LWEEKTVSSFYIICSGANVPRLLIGAVEKAAGMAQEATSQVGGKAKSRWCGTEISTGRQSLAKILCPS